MLGHRQIINDQSEETRQLLEPEIAPEPIPEPRAELPLKEIEAQAQRELEEWKDSQEADEKPEPPPAEPPDSTDAPPRQTRGTQRPGFRPKPWMKLK